MNKLLRNCMVFGGVVTLQWSGVALAECTTSQVGETTFSTCGMPIADMAKIKDGTPLSIGTDQSKGQPKKPEENSTGNAGNVNALKFKPENQR